MFQWILKKIKKNNKGFTLVELVVVIAILGILLGIAVPKLGSSRERAAIVAHNANVRTLESAANMYIADKGIPADNIFLEGTGDMEINLLEEYLQVMPEVPKGIKDKDKKEITGPYQVKMNEEGEIEVTPGKIVEGDKES